MANSVKKTNVYNIPAGRPFAKALAGRLLEEAEGSPEYLSNINILLPTRRACRVLREAFLELSGGQMLMLPRMSPLGDIDEEELSLQMTGQAGLEKLLDLKPAMAPLKRRILLARLIAARPDFRQGFDQALDLAAALGQFMDQIYTENLKMTDLTALVPAEFASHWQITLQFLEILSQEWPKILESHGCLDTADRRNRLLLALADFWDVQPPADRIIAAGSTGSIPATAKLLAVISGMPQGSVVLPGLDQDMDQESWAALDETHPQYGFKQLLSGIGLDFKDVQPWPTSRTCSVQFTENIRQILSNEIMRPAETSAAWTHLATSQYQKESLSRSLENLKILTCMHEREEANAIVLMLRETLENPDKRAVLVTPDRNLARRVAAACARWDIIIDDSAGQTLDQTPLGSFMALVLEAINQDFAPNALLALLKQHFCRASLTRTVLNNVIYQIDKSVRGPQPLPGLSALSYYLKTMPKAQDFLAKLSNIFAPLTELDDSTYAFKDILQAHIKVCEALAAAPDEPNLWTGEQGDSAAGFLADLLQHSNLMPRLTLVQYADIFQNLMKTVTVRPAYGTHPRLAILGQLEARLIDADLVILGGLNEGTWPPDSGHDPWMSRPMRKEYGLPALERAVGLAAHDFVQGLCAPEVVITRSQRIQGTPTVPARWLLRLNTVLEAAGIDPAPLYDHPYKSWAVLMDAPDKITPALRPAPRPPVDKRPRRLPATRIETWMKDPYAVYAREILRLKELNPLEQPVDAAQQGTVLHAVLEKFVRTYPNELPPDSAEILQDLLTKELSETAAPQVWAYWQARFSRMADGYIRHEQIWRGDMKPFKTEAKGAADLGNFTVTAIADRIDRPRSGGSGAAIIDYKSGGQFSQTAIKTGASPQLGVEALIAAKGGFPDLPAEIPQTLAYWVLTAGSQAAKITQVDKDVATIIKETEAGLREMIRVFDQPETPYYAVPRANNAPRFNPYTHLERLQEWADSEEEAA